MGRIGYGYNRREKDFDGLQLDKLFLDYPKSERMGRYDLWSAARPGDTIVMLAKGDLGFGGELPLLRTQLAERGVSIEIVQYVQNVQSKPGAPAAPAPRGRAPKFAPDEAADKTLRDMWRQPALFTTRHVIDRASALTGKPVTRNQLNHRYGYRGE